VHVTHLKELSTFEKIENLIIDASRYRTILMFDFQDAVMQS